jgi:hypothetical protein
MDATHSSERSVYIEPTRRHIPQDGIFHNVNFKTFSTHKIFCYIHSPCSVCIAEFASGQYTFPGENLCTLDVLHFEQAPCVCDGQDAGYRDRTVLVFLCSRIGTVELQHPNFPLDIIDNI